MQGKGSFMLPNFIMEDLLCEYGYTREHENVYYSKSLERVSSAAIPEIDFIYKNGGKSVSFMRGGEHIGGCELNLLPHSSICYLVWIYIDGKYRHQGLGAKCMNKLFYELRQKGISRLDTDTADNNVNAQGYYIKTGFVDMGRMRSYCVA